MDIVLALLMLGIAFVLGMDIGFAITKGSKRFILSIILGILFVATSVVGHLTGLIGETVALIDLIIGVVDITLGILRHNAI